MGLSKGGLLSATKSIWTSVDWSQTCTGARMQRDVHPTGKLYLTFRVGRLWHLSSAEAILFRSSMHPPKVKVTKSYVNGCEAINKWQWSQDPHWSRRLTSTWPLVQCTITVLIRLVGSLLAPCSQILEIYRVFVIPPPWQGGTPRCGQRWNANPTISIESVQEEHSRFVKMCRKFVVYGIRL